MQKPKEWVRITSGPSYKFATTRMMLLKGPTRLPCSLCLALVSLCLSLVLFYFAPISLCLTWCAQPYLALNTSSNTSLHLVCSTLPCPKH
jgi:hypothetical protein